MSPGGLPLRLVRGRGPVVVAVALVLAVLIVDVVIASDRVAVTSLMIGGPLFCGLWATPKATRWVGALAVAVAAASFTWGAAPTSSRWWIPLGVVTMGSVFAAVTADTRQRLRRDAHRMRVLADVAEVAQGGRPMEEVAWALADLLVPRLADLCAIDLLGAEGRLRRLAGVAGGRPDGARNLLGRTLGDGEPADSLAGVTEHRPVLDAAGLDTLARDDDERRLFGELGIESVIIVPLAPRGTPVGRLVLGTRSPRARLSDLDDVEYAETLAGRVALTLDNAALSAELSSAERQLEVILASVDAAVTVRDRNGRMVYANQAAADLLKLPDPAEVLAYPPGGLMRRFDVYSENGDPIDLTGMGGTRLLMGEAATPPMTVRNVVKQTGEERWLLNKATAVTGAGGGVLLAINLIEDVTETKRSEIAQRLMAQITRTLADGSSLPETLQAIVDAAVPGLADWAGVDLVDQFGRIRTLALAHRDPGKVALGWSLRRRWPHPPGMAEVIRTGEAQLRHDITDEMLTADARDAEELAILREIGLHSAMIAPIRAGERILGALTFVSASSRRFDARDLQLACDLGHQAGIVIDSAELHAAQTHIAQTLQAGLVPTSLPSIDGWTLSSAYRAAGRANEVGGDFYDVLRFPGGWAAIIGDVVGKGAEAAALTAVARHTLAAIIDSTGDLAYALQVLNRRLRARSTDYRDLCTVAAVLVTADDQVEIVSAGHPLPLLRRGASVAPVGRPSPMLGFVDDLQVLTTEVEIEPGDQFVMYTDGVLDAVGSIQRFGDARLAETVRLLPDGDATAADRILGVIDGYVDRDQIDDIAIMSLTRSPVPAPRSP